MGEGEEKGEMKNKEGRVSKGERDIEIEGRSVSGSKKQSDGEERKRRGRGREEMKNTQREKQIE